MFAPISTSTDPTAAPRPFMFKQVARRHGRAPPFPTVTVHIHGASPKHTVVDEFNSLLYLRPRWRLEVRHIQVHALDAAQGPGITTITRRRPRLPCRPLSIAPHIRTPTPTAAICFRLR